MFFFLLFHDRCCAGRFCVVSLPLGTRPRSLTNTHTSHITHRPTVPAQAEFERAVFAKTARTSARGERAFGFCAFFVWRACVARLGRGAGGGRGLSQGCVCRRRGRGGMDGASCAGTRRGRVSLSAPLPRSIDAPGAQRSPPTCPLSHPRLSPVFSPSIRIIKQKNQPNSRDHAHGRGPRPVQVPGRPDVLFDRGPRGE
jgi:hypothetical protein